MRWSRRVRSSDGCVRGPALTDDPEGVDMVCGGYGVSSASMWRAIWAANGHSRPGPGGPPRGVAVTVARWCPCADDTGAGSCLCPLDAGGAGARGALIWLPK